MFTWQAWRMLESTQGEFHGKLWENLWENHDHLWGTMGNYGELEVNLRETMIYRDLGQECQWQAVRLLCIEQNANRKNPATTRDSGKSARGNESLTKYFKKKCSISTARHEISLKIQRSASSRRKVTQKLVPLHFDIHS